jgi:hypothetical protein
VNVEEIKKLIVENSTACSCYNRLHDFVKEKLEEVIEQNEDGCFIEGEKITSYLEGHEDSEDHASEEEAEPEKPAPAAQSKAIDMFGDSLSFADYGDIPITPKQPKKEVVELSSRKPSTSSAKPATDSERFIATRVPKTLRFNVKVGNTPVSFTSAEVDIDDDAIENYHKESGTTSLGDDKAMEQLSENTDKGRKGEYTMIVGYKSVYVRAIEKVFHNIRKSIVTYNDEIRAKKTAKIPTSMKLPKVITEYLKTFEGKDTKKEVSDTIERWFRKNETFEELEQKILEVVNQWFYLTSRLMAFENAIRESDQSIVKIDIGAHSKTVPEALLSLTREVETTDSKGKSKTKKELTSYMRKAFLEDAKNLVAVTPPANSKTKKTPTHADELGEGFIKCFNAWNSRIDFIKSIKIEPEEFFNLPEIVNTINIKKVEVDPNVLNVAPIEKKFFAITGLLSCYIAREHAIVPPKPLDDLTIPKLEKAECELEQKSCFLKFTKNISSTTFMSVFKCRSVYTSRPEFENLFLRAIIQCNANAEVYRVSPADSDDFELWKALLHNKYFIDIISKGENFNDKFDAIFKELYTKKSSLRFFVTWLYPISFLFTPFMVEFRRPITQTDAINEKFGSIISSGTAKTYSFKDFQAYVATCTGHLNNIDWIYYLNPENDDLSINNRMHMLSLWYSRFDKDTTEKDA